MSEESLEKYEGIVDEDGLIDYDGLLYLIEQKNKLEKLEEFLEKDLRAFVNSNTFDHIYDAISKLWNGLTRWIY